MTKVSDTPLGLGLNPLDDRPAEVPRPAEVVKVKVDADGAHPAPLTPATYPKPVSKTDDETGS